VEEEIDLRPYIAALATRWTWIIGVSFIAALAAFIISALIPPTYKATALVAITETRQRIQFDPRIQTQEEQQPLKAFPQLATSDDLLQQVLVRLEPSEVQIDSVLKLRGLLEARPGADPSLIQLTVSYKDAAIAAQIANQWAETFVQWGNEIYRTRSDAQLLFYQSQLDETKEKLAEAQQELTTFQSRNRSTIVENRLLALSEAHINYLNNQQQTVLLLQDITGLRGQLARQNSATVTWADQFTALNLQLQAFGIQESDGSTQLQFQISPNMTLTGDNRRELLAYLDGLQSTLELRLHELDKNLTELEPEMLTLQQERQALLAELSQLARNVTVTEETYTSLARKVDEERITSQGEANSLRLASNSAVPQRPVAPRRMLNTVIAAVLGAFVVAIFISARQWWTVHDKEHAKG
jgi:polysaccharide biosynthesis transport protein